MKHEKSNEQQGPFNFEQRFRDLIKKGQNISSATKQAYMEQQIKSWPDEWGDNLEFLIFGDFQAPTTTQVFNQLGIVIYPETQEHYLFKSASTVLRATIKVTKKNIDGLADAAKRINILLGIRTLVEGGNSFIGWWSKITHYQGRLGFVGIFGKKPISPVVNSFFSLHEDVQQKITSAFLWIYASNQIFSDIPVNDTILRVYSSYWNAFECLVGAINQLKPQPKLSRNAKQKQVDEFLEKRNGRLTTAEVTECYRIVNPGFVGEAKYALTVCFGDKAKKYIDECFFLPEKINRLYDIRNAINHGDIDFSKFSEIERVKAATTRLQAIIWQMFGRILISKSEVI